MYNSIFRCYCQQTRYYLKLYFRTMQNFLFCNCKVQIWDIPKFHPSLYFFSFRAKLNNIYVLVLIFNILKNNMSQYEYLLFDESFLLLWELLGTCSIIKYILLPYTISLSSVRYTLVWRKRLRNLLLHSQHIYLPIHFLSLFMR